MRLVCRTSPLYSSHSDDTVAMRWRVVQQQQHAALRATCGTATAECGGVQRAAGSGRQAAGGVRQAAGGRQQVAGGKGKDGDGNA